MRESVYDLLNDMDHQPKEYTAENVSEKISKSGKKLLLQNGISRLRNGSNMPLQQQSSAPSRQGL